MSDVARLEDAQVNVTFSSGWDAVGKTGALVALLQRARRAWRSATSGSTASWPRARSTWRRSTRSGCSPTTSPPSG
ncbi:MAG: hypothetical protein R2697_09455 [Ilumatobacteraceae bacterium]